MRYNPFWFDNSGNPTKNLLDIYSELKAKLEKNKFLNPIMCVVGSNARGNFKTLEDLERILEITERAKIGQMNEEDLSFLKIFYSEEELNNYFFNKTHRYFLNPGKLYVSDLDIKISGNNLPKNKRLDLILELSNERKGNDYWNGVLHVMIYDFFVVPYYQFNKGWVL